MADQPDKAALNRIFEQSDDIPLIVTGRTGATKQVGSATVLARMTARVRLSFDDAGRTIAKHVRRIGLWPAAHRSDIMDVQGFALRREGDDMATTDPTNQDRYFGVRDFVNGGYDGLILQQFKDGGLTLYYMSTTGWVENNGLIEDLHDADTVPITADEAAKIADKRFGHTLAV